MSNPTAPTLVSATPSLNTSAVDTSADIVLTFSEAMAAGTGLITISDGVTQTYLGKDGAMHTRLIGATDTRTVSITDTSQVTVSGNTVTINLTADLQSGKSYSVQMGKSVLFDTAGNAYAGLSDSTRLHFTTSTVAVPGATVDGVFSMTDTGSSTTDFITRSAAQTVSGKYTGTLATGDFVEVSLDNGAHWITATTSAADNTWSATGTIAASSTVIARVSNAANAHSTAAHHAFTYDVDAPAVSQIGLSNNALATGETPTVTVTFSEAVTGLDVSDFTVTGGALSNLVSSEDGKTWTATLTPSSDSGGSGSVQLNAASVADIAGNSGPAAPASAAFTYTGTPTVTIVTASMTDTGASNSDFITNSTAQSLSGTLSAALASNEKVQVSLDDGNTWTDATSSGANWSLAGQTISASNTLLVRVSNGTAHGTEYSHSYTLDQTAPTASVTLSDSKLTTGETTTVTITFDAAVSGLAISDFTVTGGSIGTPVSTDGGATWTATLTPSTHGKGSVQLNTSTVTDTAGNSGPASAASIEFSYDTKPVVAITSAAFSNDTGASNSDFITNASSQTISGKLSAALLSGEKVQVSLDNGGTWTEAITSGTNWTLAGQTLSASNTLQARVAYGTTYGSVYSHSYTLDHTAPTASVTLGDSALTTGETTTVTITFNEAVSGLTSSDFTVTGGSIGTPVSTDGGATWTSTLTPSTHGKGSVQLNTSTVTDTAGNSGPGSAASIEFSYDTTPVVTITHAAFSNDTGASSSDFITNTASQTVSGTLSAALLSGEKVQVSLNNGSTWTDATTSGTSWSLSEQSLSASNTLQVRVANGATHGEAYSHSYILDQVAPTASVTLGDSTLTAGETTTVTITFDAAVSGLAVSDFTVTGGSIGTPSTSDGGTTWTATLTPSANGSGSVQLTTSTVTDTAGNSGPATQASASFTYDSTPTATIASAQFSNDTGDSGSDFITNSASQTISGTLSATLLSGEKVQVSLDNGGTWTDATTSGTSWSLSEQSLSASNTLQVRVANDTTHSAAYSHAYTLDQGAPTLSSFTLDDNTLGSGQSATVTMVFNEKVVGLASTDFTVSGGTLGTLSSSDGITWTGTLTPTASGSVAFSTGSVSDVAGNSGPASAPSAQSFTYDATAPTATLTLNDNKLTSGETATLTVTLSEAVTDTPLATDFTVTGGALGTFTSTDGGTTWTATLTPTSSAAGAGSITLSAGSISDPYGNAGPASAIQLSFDYDTQTPALASNTVALSSDTGAYADDFITQTSSQTVTGSFTGTVYSATGAKIEVSANNGETWTSATVNNTTHTWSASETLSGSSTLKVRLTDSSGATSTESHTYKIDTTAPGSLASITPELNRSSDTDNGDNGTTSDHITSNDTPTVNIYVADLSSSSFPAGDFIDILDTSNGNALVGTHTITSSEIGSYGGNVEVALSSALSEGSHTLVARARDLAGNTGTQSSEALTVTIDKTVASMASHTVDLAAASDLGLSSTDNITSDNMPTVTVNVANTSNLSAGDILQIYDTTNSVVVGSHTLTATDFSSSGSDISITLDTLDDGVHALAMRVYDQAGNVGTQSTSTTSVTIDTEAPTLSSSSPSSEALNVSVGAGITLTFDEALDVHSNVSFELSNNSSPSDTRSFVFEASSGNLSSYDETTHSITLTPASNLLTDGSYTLTFSSGTLTDVAGNIFQEPGTSFLSFSSESGNIVVVDPIPTPDPVTLALTETTYASHSGTDDDGYTSNNTLAVTGITASHLKYSLDGGASWTIVSSDLSGSSYSITLEARTYEMGSIQAAQYSSTDYVSSVAQTSQNWTIDTSAPQLWINSASSFTGLGDSTGVSITIGWDGEVNTDSDVIEYSTDGSSWTTASALTSSSATLGSVKVAAGGEVEVRATDKAGNAGTYSGLTYVAYFGDSTAATHTATGGKHLFLQGADDTVNISGDSNVVYASNGENTLNITGGSGNSVVGGDDVDTVNITGTSSNSAAYTFAGNDIITIGSSVTSTTVDAGSGNDTITISNTSNINSINGGDGTDTITFNTSASLSSLVDKVTNIEKLYVSSGDTLTINSVTKSDLTAMGFSSTTVLEHTYAVVKVDGDIGAHLTLGVSSSDSINPLKLGTGFSTANSLVVSALSELATGYYTYVDSTNNVIVLVGNNFITS